MASVQAEEDRDTTDKEIAARESIPVGHTGIVATFSEESRSGLCRVLLLSVFPPDESCRQTEDLKQLIVTLLTGQLQSVVLVKRTEDGWHDLLTMHND